MSTVRVGVVAVLTCLVLQQVRCAERLDVRQLLEHHARQRRGVTSQSFRWKRDATGVDLDNLPEVLSLEDDAGVDVVQTSKTVQGTQIVKLQETYKGEEVWDGLVTVETDQSGQVIDASGTVYRHIGSDLDPSAPVLNREEALDRCLGRHGHANLNDAISQVEVKEDIMFDADSRAYQAFTVTYLVQTDRGLRRPSCIVDAREPGAIIYSWDTLESCSNCRAKGIGGNIKIGKIRYGELQRCLDVRREGDVCYLENKYVRVVHNHFTEVIDAAIEKYLQTNNVSQEEMVEVEQLNQPISYDCEDLSDDAVNGAFSPALDAFFYGTVVSKMFEEWYDIPLPVEQQLKIRVHFGEKTENAFWSGKECVFGDGDTTLMPLVSLDVIGHEVGHGVTEKNSNLLYFQQWGGINEAFSDMTGETAEAYFGKQDWLIGAEIMVPGTVSAMRYFQEPEIDNASISNIANYTEFMDVHYSSGVYNKVFYILVHDMQLPVRQVYGVFLHANRLYWHHMSSYASAACDVTKAAYDLGQDGSKFRQAFSEVGVEVCDVDHHVMGLIKDQEYGNITVGRDTHPTFTFSVPEFWPEYVTIVANSSQGDVIINVTNTKWGDPEEEVMTLASETGSLTLNVSELVANSEVVLTITLFTISHQLLSDVTLQAAYQCGLRASAGVEEEFSSRLMQLKETKALVCGEEEAVVEEQEEEQETEGHGEETEGQGEVTEGQGEEMGGQGEETENQGEKTEDQGEKMEGQGEETKGQGEDTEGQAEEPEGQGEETEGQAEETEGQGDETESQGEETKGQEEETEGQGEETEGQGEETEGQGDETEGQEEETGGQGEETENQGEKTEDQGEKMESQGEETEGQGEDTEGQGEEPEGQGEETEGQAEETEGQGDETESQGEENEGQEEETEGQGEETEGQGEETEGQGEETEGQGDETEGQEEETGGEVEEAEGQGEDTEDQGKETEGQGKEMEGQGEVPADQWVDAEFQVKEDENQSEEPKYQDMAGFDFVVHVDEYFNIEK